MPDLLNDPKVLQTTLTPTKYRQEYVQLSFGKVKKPVEGATKPQQQHHSKSSPTADEGVADASGSSLACLANLAVHKTIDLDTTANLETTGQAQKANSEDSPEGRPEQNDQSNSLEAIEDPQEVTLVQESAADGTAIVAEEKDPVVAADETVSSEKTPNKEVSVSDGVPVITGDTDVNNRSGHQLIFSVGSSQSRISVKNVTRTRFALSVVFMVSWHLCA